VKTIKLNKVNIQNFKGIAIFDYQFNGENATFISKSGEGKTSVLESLKWLCGTNMADIFPVINENLISNIVTKVEAEIAVDNLVYTIKRESKQKIKHDKWDATLVRFEGNESKYFIDEMEYTLTNFKKRIEEITEIEYEDFLLLLDIKEFNNKDWKFQRKWLFDHCGVEEKVQTLNSAYDLLQEDFAKKLDEADIQSHLNSVKVQIRNKQQENIKEIESLNSEMLNCANQDYESIEKDKNETNAKISQILSEKAKTQVNTLLEEKLSKMSQIKAQLSTMESEVYNHQRENDTARRQLENAIEQLNRDINRNSLLIQELKGKETNLKATLKEFEGTQFSADQTICSFCGQKLPDEKITDNQKAFESTKAFNIDTTKEKIDQCEKDIAKTETEKKLAEENLVANQKTLEDLKNITIDTQPLETLRENLSNLQKEIETLQAQDNADQINEQIENQLTELQAHYDECVRNLMGKTRLEEINKRMAEIKNENLDLAEKDQQRVLKQNQLNDYIRAKIQATNDAVNSFFDGVSFKFFELNTDLAEKPFNLACSACLEGKDYDKQSTGQKIRSDILVQKGIQNILGVNMFMFVDEAGSTSYDYSIGNQLIVLLTLNKFLQDKGVSSNFAPTKIESVYSEKDCFVR